MRGEDTNINSNGTSRPYANGSSSSPVSKVAISSTSNGVPDHWPPRTMNGSSTNGHTSDGPKPRPTYYDHDREEVTRLIIQTLADLGYENSFQTLMHESGYSLESPPVTAFRNAVLHGEWNEAEELLFGGSTEEGGVSINGDGLVLRDGVDKNVMRFWLRQQKFLELLEMRDTGRAIMVLRTELTPLYQDTAKLHFLSSLLMCRSAEELKQKAEWDGAEGDSRYSLLSDLSNCISPSVFLPPSRLATLLSQVKRNQILSCLYHNTASSPSLYQDHSCDRSNFPVQPVRDISKHSGEVWYLRFSNDGTRLASCGSDGNVIIYDVSTFNVQNILHGNEQGMCSFTWSPDDSMIVTCCLDRKVKLWNAHTGELKKTLPRFGEPVSSSVWAPDGRSFVTGCLDTDGNLCQWNLNGEKIYDWGRQHRIQCLAVSPNGHHLVAMDATHHVHVYNFVTRELEYDIDLKVKLSSISISQDSRSLLVFTSSAEARLIDLATRQTIKTYRSSEKGGDNVIRADFGGASESFVISGSEGGSIYIWHKENGQLIEQLRAHEKGPCNTVSWNPTDPSMFASGGDDGKVRIWSSDERLQPALPKDSGESSRSRESNGL